MGLVTPYKISSDSISEKAIDLTPYFEPIEGVEYDSLVCRCIGNISYVIVDAITISNVQLEGGFFEPLMGYIKPSGTTYEERRLDVSKFFPRARQGFHDITYMETTELPNHQTSISDDGFQLMWNPLGFYGEGDGGLYAYAKENCTINVNELFWTSPLFANNFWQGEPLISGSWI